MKIVTHKCSIFGVFTEYGQIFTVVTNQIISYPEFNQASFDIYFLLCNQFSGLLILFFILNTTL